MTVRETLIEAESKFAPLSDDPRLDAEVLLANVMVRDRAWLATHAEDAVSSVQRRHFHRLVERRVSGEPVAYIVGHQAFRYGIIQVTPDVLIPRPATEAIVAAVIAMASEHSITTIADIGTGSGVIAVTLAKELPGVRLTATDISPAAIEVARANAASQGVADRIDFLTGSLGEPLRDHPAVDLVVANLPYVTPAQMQDRSIRAEPQLALEGGADGLTLVRALLVQLAARPPNRGIMLEVDQAQVTAVQQQAARHWPNATIRPIDDGSTARGVAILWPPEKI